MILEKTITGQKGIDAVIHELTHRGHIVKCMPNHNKGFDIDCCSPTGCKFRVEVKTSSSTGRRSQFNFTMWTRR
jgi:uncharacterized protein DUF3883